MNTVRRIHLPNTVQSVNTTFSCRIRGGPADVNALADHTAPREIVSQLTVEHFFVTFASVTSAFNGVDPVEYKEVIIKIPVVAQERDFVFPLRTYVNNELSLVRGYQFGFNKYMTAVEDIVDNHAIFDGFGFQIDARIRENNPKASATSLTRATSPFILSANGSATALIISDYVQYNDSGWKDGSGAGFLGEDLFDVEAVRITADGFVLHKSTSI